MYKNSKHDIVFVMKKVIKKVFYPHTKHNPKPLFWSTFSVSLFTIGILGICGFLTIQKIETTGEYSLLSDIRSGVLISFTNKERTNIGLETLIESQTLTKAAQLKANDMASNGYFNHYSPLGISPWFWFTQAGYEYQKAGENLAVNFKDSKDIVDAWMNSPTHRDNIIKDGYSEIGIASAEGIYKGKKATFVVQLFAAPKIDQTSRLAFAIEKIPQLALGEQVSVKGTEITVYQDASIFSIFSNHTYTLIILLTILSSIIFMAIVIILLKGKMYTRQFYISIFVLSLALIISIATEIVFFRDISVSFIK